ncbi:glycosyltransferase family 2 protein [Pseudooceanicola sp. LIPI14-2-Ac024]|uniref:glycosyltransferase family 2 protein n=1 Tax=Pseudooceanicola sp. LIPI14-2-Ac024 TaxID=3344875 RepID=UPI0035CF1633
MKTAVLTSVRNDSLFLDLWLDYYGGLFGAECLYVVIDGFDQPVPDRADPPNILRVPFVASDRATGDRRRARLISDIARGLHRLYDAVIAVDVDEFLLADPAQYPDLAALLAGEHQRGRHATLSGLGLDVAQNTALEAPIDTSRPILQQRRFAQLSTRYTKPSVAFRPVTWGSGYHRVKRRNFHIHPHLYLVHLGMMDHANSTQRSTDADRIDNGWTGHMARRQKVFDVVTGTPPTDFDSTTTSARRMQTWLRPPYAWNKPLMPGAPRVVRIPDRFAHLL